MKNRYINNNNKKLIFAVSEVVKNIFSKILYII